MKCTCGQPIPDLLGTLRPGASGAAFHCPCGRVYSVSIDVAALHRRVDDLAREVTRLTDVVAAMVQRSSALAASVLAAGEVQAPVLPPKRWGIWILGGNSIRGIRMATNEARWCQGGGIPGPRYEQGTKEEMTAWLARENATNPCWPPGCAEVRELPPELAEQRYKGGQ